MAKNILVVSCDIAETRVALIESGIIAELHIERRGAQPRGGTVGDVCLGKVTRVLPGLQAAFIDIGLERAAFLHVEDLIRPDDFEAYLAGARRPTGGGSTDSDADAPPDAAEADHAEGRNEAEPSGSEDEATPAEVAADPAGAAEASDAADSREDADVETSDDDWASAEEGSDGPTPPPDLDSTGALSVSGVDAVPSVPEVVRESESHVAAAPSASALTEAAPSDDIASFDDEDDDSGPGASGGGFEDILDDPNLPGFTVTDPGAPVVPRAPAPRAEGRRGGDRRGRGRGRGRGRDRGADRGNQREDRGGRDHRPRASGLSANRISKSTPIRDVVKEGQEIIVQITKEPIGTKGARCSSHISLPGRYVVYLPTLDHVGVSKRIGSDKERARLRETIESMKPQSGGLIVRTVAEGLTKKQLKQDVGYLVQLWGEVAKKRDGAKAPATLLSELDIVLKTARDLLTDEVDQLVIDDKGQYDRLHRFVEAFMPERLKDIVYYDGEEPIFDAYGIEDEIARALSRKVPLPSGGYLIIDEAEALTAIDVNTGRFVGKGSKDMEETILKTNLEAVQEIAYQLRFRNIGGLIILDLIDMEKASNREKVRKTLEELLHRDKAKTTLNRISELGLIEMTRKRTRESLGRLLHEPCFYCDGTGHLQSKETICYEILREIRRRRHDLPGYSIVVSCHPAVADLLTGTEKAAVQDAESKYMRRIQVTPRTEYHLEQFDLTGK
jgi:ribonuclease G